MQGAATVRAGRVTKKNILITGVPGSGKTTLITNLADDFKRFDPAGLYTVEIREHGIRRGFEIVGLDGRRGILSHVDIKSHYRVGAYGVDVGSFEKFLDALSWSNAGLLIIDEIGKMECLSRRFVALMKEVLDSEKLVIATIALKNRGFIAEVKARGDVKLFEVTMRNRDALEDVIEEYVAALEKQMRYGD